MVSSSHAALAPYAGPWDRRRAAHLIRRQGFGARKRDVDRALAAGSAEAAVSALLAEAVSQSAVLLEPPGWYRAAEDTGVEEVYDVQRLWLDGMRTGGLLDKMTLFWHNHFATEWTATESKTDASIAHLTFDHYGLLRTNALGNVQTLVRTVGLDASMLVYLDGAVNAVGQANENYARELLELFTMGQTGPDGAPNYTETDIQELARALTGWTVGSDRRVRFEPDRHDAGAKTIFGQTQPFDYDGALDLVFATRTPAIAHFVARKLYCFFVQPRPDAAIVQALADLLVTNGFEVAPVVRALLASAHFYDDALIAARVKSPLEWVVGFLREAEVTPSRNLLEWVRRALEPVALGQELFNPPNVAGWPGLNPPASDGQPGYFAWVTTGSLPERWSHLDDLLGDDGYDPFELAQKVSDPSDPLRLAGDLAETLLPVPLDVAGIHPLEEPFGGNPDFPPPDAFLNGPAQRVDLAKYLLDGTPHYEWPRFEDGRPEHVEEARTLLRRYLTYLVQLPEYQLT